MTIGDRIRILRIEKGWSQAELAAACGLNRNSIYKYEKNESMPRMPKVRAIAEALGVPMDTLFTGQLETTRLTAQMEPALERGTAMPAPPQGEQSPLSLYDEYFALLQKHGVTHAELAQVADGFRAGNEEALADTPPVQTNAGAQDGSFFSLIEARESCRAYAERPVEHEKLMRCLQAARVAPSACNSQPWSFVVVETEALVQQIAKSTQSIGMNKFTESCHCFVVIIEEKATLSARLGGKVKDQDYASVDIGLATAHLCLAATAQGLSTCILGWFDEQRIKSMLSVPADRRIRLVICVGYPQAYEPRAKVRKPLDEIARFV